ncbi:MBL fold metallo-hydrolase [Actinomadura geliboluensis]|uniref:MBL fold metallo-hydrolase n=1 Tax=Actinomadura geliboluensis TaxID=882440 RepID=UPI0036B2DD64
MPESSTAALSYEVFVSEPIPTTGTLPTGAPQQWSPISTTLISGGTDAVLVDPPFTIEQTRRIGDWVERSGKRLTGIYITHGHGDHWFGASLLAERFPGVPVRATEGTIRLMRDSATGRRKAFWDKLFPGQLPDVRVSAQALPADGLTLEGHPLHAIEVGHSDCDDSTVLHVPALGLVVAGDVAYNNVHQYLADGGLDGGIDACVARHRHGAGPATGRRGRRPQGRHPPRPSTHPRRDRRIPAHRPPSARRQAHGTDVLRRDDAPLPGPAQPRHRLAERAEAGLMRAVRFHEFGGRDVLRIDQLPQPEPDADSVVIRIARAGVSPLDDKVRTGVLPSSMRKPLPLVPGASAVGRVEDPGTSGHAPGARVLLCGWGYGMTRDGTWRELAAVRPSHLVPVPDDVSDDDAAGLVTDRGT